MVGRKSPYSLYDKVIASFEDDKGLYNQGDAGVWVCGLGLGWRGADNP